MNSFENTMRHQGKTYFAVFIVILALLFQWYAHGKGLLLTQDSLHYIAGGESFKNSRSFIDLHGNYFLFWPPLFSLMLSIFKAPVNQFVWVNGIVTIVIAITTFRILGNLILHPLLGMLCLTFILLGVHLLLISTFLWSEMIFIALVLIFIDQLQRSKESRRYLYFALAAGFFMCLQRNAGMFITAGGSAWYFFSIRNSDRALLKSILFFLVVNSGLFIWNIYTWIILPHAHFSFSDEFFQYAFLNTNALTSAVIHVFFPVPFMPIPLFVITFAGYLFFMKDELQKNILLQLIFIVTTTYLVFIYFVLAVNIAGFPVDFGEADRFIAPIVPFIGMMIFKLFEKIVARKQINSMVVILIICCWMCYPLARTVSNARQWHNTKINYAPFKNGA